MKDAMDKSNPKINTEEQLGADAEVEFARNYGL